MKITNFKISFRIFFSKEIAKDFLKPIYLKFVEHYEKCIFQFIMTYIFVFLP